MRRNGSSEQLCPQYYVGYTADDLQDCENRSSLSQLVEKCSVFDIQYGFIWLQLLSSLIHRPSVCNGPLFRYKVYPHEGFDQVTNDLTDGQVDIYPMTKVLKANYSQHYIGVTVQRTTDYNLYTKQNDEYSSDFFQRAAFLLRPFRPTTWWCFVASLACCRLLMLSRQHGKLPSASCGSDFRRLYDISFVAPLTFVGIMYASVLKAMTVYPTVHVPFDSLRELGERLEQRELQMLVETMDSQRYKTLTSISDRYGEELIRLVNTINNTPGSVLVANGMQDVCKLMRLSNRYVFFGYDELLFTSCNDLCFWKYKDKAIPHEYVTFLLKRNSSITNVADLSTYILPNYRQMLTKRKSITHCGGHQNSSVPRYTVTVSSLFYVIALLLAGWMAAMASWLIEVIYYRFHP